MPSPHPISPSQRAALKQLPPNKPLLLQIQWAWTASHLAEESFTACMTQLHALGGSALTHARCDSQVIGQQVRHWHSASIWALPTAHALESLIDSEAFKALAQQAEHMRALVAVQAPRAMQTALRLGSLLMRFLPAPAASRPIPIDAISGGVNPTPEQFDAFKASPQNNRIHMFNLLKFNKQVQATTPGTNHTKSIGGQRLYGERYAPVATQCIFRLGGRIVAIGRYKFTLIGECGQTAPDAWDELVVVQYPGRSAFLRMLSNPMYQEAVRHREVALAHTELWATSPDIPLEKFFSKSPQGTHRSNA